MALDPSEAPALRIGFIGPGRLGKTLAWAFARAGLTVAAVAGRGIQGAQALAERVPGCVVMDAQDVVDHSDIVFITTPDRAIGPCADGLRWRKDMAVVHCSGVTEVDALHAAAAQGSLLGGFHPLQAFGDSDIALRSLPGSTITIEAPEPLYTLLATFADHIDCRAVQLPPGMRGRYHAAAGYTSQFINVLMAGAVRIWRSWGATDEEAIAALAPMVRGSLDAIQAVGIAQSMPGPVSRGDVDSIAKHVDALAEVGPDTLALYQALCAASVPLALAAGTIDARTAEQFYRVLGRAPHGDIQAPEE